jgi:hypothetical protein
VLELYKQTYPRDERPYINLSVAYDRARSLWRSLNDLLKNLTNAEACLQNLDLKLTADHLKVAKWNVGEVKKAIAGVGQAKTTKTG